MATETYELTLDGLCAASYRSNVLHFSGVGVASGDTLAAGESLINGFDAAAKTAFLATLPASYSLMQLRARRATPKPSAVAHKTYGAFSAPGTRGSNATAQQTCPSIFLIPTMGTPSGGKIFWPCIPQGDVNQSSYAAGWKTAVDAWFTIVRAGFTNAGITWTLAIFSKKTLGTSAVTNYTYSPLIGFQSKRRKPVGAVG